MEAVYQAASVGLLLAAKLAIPIILASGIVGLVVSFLQSLFQLSEQSLTFLPKVLVVGLVILMMGPYIGVSLIDFFYYVIRLAFN